MSTDAPRFTLAGNTVDTGPFADGYWHFQDVVLLPWIARQAPNTTSQPTQTSSVEIGRYSFVGDLNLSPFFHEPAQSC